MKRIKRISALLMALLLVFSSMAAIPVSAATEGTNTTIDAAYRCVKGSNTGISGTAPLGDNRFYWHYNADGTALNCPIRFLKESGTGRPVYCIEVGATFSGYTYSTQSLTTSPYWNSLSTVARAGITYCTMYGYPVNTWGAANCDAYAATQTIIWEFAKGYRNLSGRTNAYYYNLMIKGSPAENAYNQLGAAVTAHNKRPSFAYTSAASASSNTVELKYNAASGAWTVTLTDSNGVLSGYNVTASGGLTVSKSGNTLTLSTSNEIGDKAQLTLERPLPNTGQALLALYSPTSQNGIIGQLQDPVTSYLSLSTEDVKGKVSVNKVDEAGNKLTGVVFGVFSDSACSNLITTMTTQSGAATSGDINVSQHPTVYVKETSMSEALDAVYTLNPTVYTVTMQRNTTVAVNDGTAVVNEWKDGNVRVVKQNEAGTGLAGVVFGVYSDSACSKLLTRITTGSDGAGTSAAIDVGASGSRTVYVKEISITAEQAKQYSMNATVYPVTVSAGRTVTANDGKAVVNEWLPARISVTKSNSAGTLLSGAEFTAYTDEACGEVLKDTSGKAVVLTTGDNGSATSAEIDVGASGGRTVYVKETAINHADSDILALNDTVFSVTLQPNVTTAVNGGEPVVNQYKPGRIKVVKENQNGNRLAGITFSVYTDKSCRTLLTTIVTDEHGVGVSEEISIDGTGERTLYVRETALTDEQKPLYELSSTVYKVTVFPNQTIQANNGKTIINRWTLGQISLSKENINGDRLADVTFAIFEDSDCLTPLLGANGKQVTMTTCEDGTALSEGIEVGNNGTRKLFVREHSMDGELNDRYMLNSTVFPVVISAGTVAKLNDGKPVVNEWQNAQLSLSKINPAEKPIAGAVFTAYTDAECSEVLKDANGKEVVLTTGEDGCANSAEIAVGKDGTLTVFLRETAVADETVMLNPTVFEVTLMAGEITAANDGAPIVDEWLPARIELTKTNEAGQPLAGVTFGVFDDADCTIPAKDVSGTDVVLVTDDNGRASSPDIFVNADGERRLYVKELSVTDEQAMFYSINPTVFEAVITPNMTVLVNGGNDVVNYWLPATLSITKQDEEGRLMAGVTFGVYDDEACTISATDVSGSDVLLVTDETGCASSADIPVGKDGSRTVYVKETGMSVSDADVYSLNNTVFKVELNAGQNSAVNGGEPVINKFTTAKVSVKKADFATAEGIAGATIQIYDSSGAMVYEGVTLADGYTEEIELRVGTYTFVETVAPVGYQINKTVFEFTVNPDGTITGDCTVTDKPTEWTITKSDVTTAKPLAGAEITIYDADGNVVFKDTTGEDGTITAFRLPAGTYTFKETLTPEGYVINEETFTFTIDAEGNVTGDNSITDRRIKGNIKVIKTDEDTGDALAGAVFGLYSSDGKTKLAEGTTGEDGTLTFADMEYGDYLLKEESAPSGYFWRKNEYRVSIKEDGVTVEVDIANYKEQPSGGHVPATGDDSSNTPLVVCLALMFISAGALVVLWFIKSGRAEQLKACKNDWWRKRSYNCDRNGGYRN